MKIAWICACSLIFFSACAGLRQSTAIDCSREASQSRGVKDGASGHGPQLSFLHSCSIESRSSAQFAYREGFEEGRAQREPEFEKIESEIAFPLTNLDPSPVRKPAADSWVCEVEAQSKVFTGIGGTRDEALVSARSNCGSHFQASSCNKADCKQSF